MITSNASETFHIYELSVVGNQTDQMGQGESVSCVFLILKSKRHVNIAEFIYLSVFMQTRGLKSQSFEPLQECSIHQQIGMPKIYNNFKNRG